MGCETLSVPEAAKVLGVGRVRMYEAVRQGRVRALKVGTKPKYRIPKKVIAQLLDDPQGFNREKADAEALSDPSTSEKEAEERA